jgi:hypothetical protein
MGSSRSCQTKYHKIGICFIFTKLTKNQHVSTGKTLQQISLYGHPKRQSGLMLIKLLSTNTRFVLLHQNHPIRALYIFDTVFSLAVFRIHFIYLIVFSLADFLVHFIYLIQCFSSTSAKIVFKTFMKVWSL